ncbi:hypothetical protein NP493_918g00000 [Ridgeia piscesae]|uniref:cyclin-dependent kinase n=1 Tax=Ridgeia piscesae TaxID=27915 RepID=A0AAD9NLP3_RIDPI|nr:hypothetical protein NP493_918g00000 [Ridgeia piscesae]
MSEPTTSPMEQGELEQSPDIIHLSPDIELVMPEEDVEPTSAPPQGPSEDARQVVVVNESEEEAFSDEKEEEKEVKATKGKHHSVETEEVMEDSLQIQPPQASAGGKKDKHRHKRKEGRKRERERDMQLNRDRDRTKHKGRDERVERRSEGAWEWEMMRMKDREEETRRREKSRRERERLEHLERERHHLERERQRKEQEHRERILKAEREREKERERTRKDDDRRWPIRPDRDELPRRRGRDQRKPLRREDRSRSPRSGSHRSAHSSREDDRKRPALVKEAEHRVPLPPVEDDAEFESEEEEEEEHHSEEVAEEAVATETNRAESEVEEEHSHGSEAHSSSDDSSDSNDSESDSAESGSEEASSHSSKHESEESGAEQEQEQEINGHAPKVSSKFDEQSEEESEPESEPPSENDIGDTYIDDSPPLSPVPMKTKLPPYFPAIQGCRSVEEFNCLNRIEEGTYGVVYRAKDKKSDEIVALKRLKMEKEKDGFPITSLREINTLLKAQHINIVTVREIVVGSNMDKIYIVMDYVEHDLKSLMETMKDPFMIGEVKTLMIQLLRGVAHLHDNWIIHRDLKTSNLLLSHKGILKIGDFGLAREYGSPLRHYTPIVVTLWYRAPELLLGTKLYSTPIDLWSVGAIFAEFLTRKPLFPGKSEIDELNRIFKELGTPNEDIWVGVSQLPAMKKCTFTEYPYNQLRNRFGSLLTDKGFDCMNRFLTYNPDRRITAEEALKHEYFRESPLPIDPSMFPTWPAKSEQPARVHGNTPKPPSGGKAYAKLMDEDDDSRYQGFHLVHATKGVAASGPGFALKF